MKTLLTIATLLLAFSIQNNAQIPNNGFENWTTVGSYEDPNGWSTMNSICPPPFKSCTKSTDHYPASVGSFSIRLECNTALTQATGAYGGAVTGGMYYPFRPAFKITGHPGRLNGYYKYDSKNNDSCWVMAVLFKNGVIVSRAQFNAMGPNTWSPFDEEFDTYGEADSATLFLFAFFPDGPTSAPKGNSVLYIDNLSFDGLIQGQNETSLYKNNFEIYPNPASESIHVSINGRQKEALKVNLFNINGCRILSEVHQEDAFQLNTSGLESGLYFIEIQGNDISTMRRVMIQN